LAPVWPFRFTMGGQSMLVWPLSGGREGLSGVSGRRAARRPTDNPGPFLPWSRYHYLTSRPQFHEVFHLNIRLAGSTSPWCFGLIMPSRLSDAIRILYSIPVQFLGPTLRWGWLSTIPRYCLHSHEPKIILQPNDFNTFEYHKFHLNLCKRIVAWFQCKKHCILLNSRSELLEALNLYI
jgi:hypothetical protein